MASFVCYHVKMCAKPFYSLCRSVDQVMYNVYHSDGVKFCPSGTVLLCTIPNYLLSTIKHSTFLHRNSDLLYSKVSNWSIAVCKHASTACLVTELSLLQ